MRNLKLFLYLCVIFGLLGCASIKEGAKVVLGTSVKSLDEARIDALSKTYYCDFDDCFDAILVLDRNRAEARDEELKQAGFFDIFQKDRIQGVIVVMGIAGNVDTTEVGIFLESVGRNAVKIDISSLSSTAKRKVSRIVFQELDSRFSIKE